MMQRLFWILLSLIIIVIDQLTKLWAIGVLLPYQPVDVLPHLNWTLAFNTGSAFSFLSGTGAWHRWFFIVFSLSVSIFLIFFILQKRYTGRLQAIALSLILGGAVGNLLDRFTYGYVIDFIDIYYKNYHWPIFNFADISICIGVFCFLLNLNKQVNKQAND